MKKLSRAERREIIRSNWSEREQVIVQRNTIYSVVVGVLIGAGAAVGWFTDRETLSAILTLSALVVGFVESLRRNS